MTTDHSDGFWTLEGNDNDYNLNRLRVYSVDRRRSDGNVTWRDINVPTTDEKHIALPDSRQSYDGNMNIFLSEFFNKAVHVLSVDDKYYCELLSSHHIQEVPCRLALKKERQQLYVVQVWGVVGMFKLTYGERGSLIYLFCQVLKLFIDSHYLN